MKKYLAFNALLVLLPAYFLNIGCARSMQVHKLPNQIPQSLSTKVYVFRPSIGAYAININIYENSGIIGQIGPRGYLGWETNPGSKILQGEGGLTSDRRLDFIKLEAQPGKTYYFKLKSRTSIRLIDFIFVEISEKEGEKLLSKIKEPKVKIVS